MTNWLRPPLPGKLSLDCWYRDKQHPKYCLIKVLLPRKTTRESIKVAKKLSLLCGVGAGINVKSPNSRKLNIKLILKKYFLKGYKIVNLMLKVLKKSTNFLHALFILMFEEFQHLYQELRATKSVEYIIMKVETFDKIIRLSSFC